MVESTTSAVDMGSSFEQRFEEVLFRRGKVDPATLQRAHRASRAGNEPLHCLLSKLGMVAEVDVAEALAESLDLELVSATDYPNEPVHDGSLSVSFLKSSKIVPLSNTDDALIVAMANPLDADAVSSLRLYARKPVIWKVGVPADIETALDRLFGQDSTVGDLLEEADAAGGVDVLDDVERLRDLASEAPVVRIVNRLIINAIEQRASDIHIEPFEQCVRVRYRIDGMLKDGGTVSRDLHAALISRLKIMAALNIAERRLPQDGRIKLTVRGRDIDLRVGTMPILHGEAIALRILNRVSVELDFDKLGFSSHSLNALRRSLDLPDGIALVTGPTGAGKTTTLYTSLLELNTGERKVATIENPIEYQIDGINQVQVRPQIGLDFADVLRAMLRHDPDVIMVGEIRHLETAEIAIQAALTGHLVLSTIHTNSAAATLLRLLDMGIEPFLLASTVNLVIAQRLVRRLCKVCRETYELPPDMLKQIGLDAKRRRTLWRARGCQACQQTGYRGRVGIYEVLVMQDSVRQEVLKGAATDAVQNAACKAGMVPMVKDGIEKASRGITTIEEVLRVSRKVA